MLSLSSLRLGISCWSPYVALSVTTLNGLVSLTIDLLTSKWVHRLLVWWASSPLHTNFGLPRPFCCPVRSRHATDRRTDRHQPSFYIFIMPYPYRGRRHNKNKNNNNNNNMERLGHRTHSGNWPMHHTHHWRCQVNSVSVPAPLNGPSTGECGPRSPSKTQCPPNESPLQPLTLFFNIYAPKNKKNNNN